MPVEILWFAMLAFSSLSYAARPQGFLLAMSWFCTYVAVLSFGSHVSVAIFDLWFAAVSIPLALHWARGRWVWIVVAGHMLYLVGFAAQWLIWWSGGPWIGEAFYWSTRIIFTVQCAALLFPTYRELKSRRRRRLRMIAATPDMFD